MEFKKSQSPYWSGRLELDIAVSLLVIWVLSLMVLLCVGMAGEGEAEPEAELKQQSLELISEQIVAAADQISQTRPELQLHKLVSILKQENGFPGVCPESFECKAGSVQQFYTLNQAMFKI